MNETSLAAKIEAWHRELLRTETQCATYYARRVPEWIALSNRIWETEFSTAPHIGRTLQQELTYSSRREVELRAEFTRRAFGELAERGTDTPAPALLVETTRKAAELIRMGCRDVVRDIEHAARILAEMDARSVERAISAGTDRITDHLLDIVGKRPDFSL